MSIYKKLLFLINYNERRFAILLLFLTILMAFADMIGVASILPFMLALTNIEIVQTNLFLKKLFDISMNFGVENHQQFIFFLGGVVFILLILASGLKALTTYLQVRFIIMQEYRIGKRLVERYLRQPYSWFLSQHSADLGKTVLSEVNQIIGNGITPFIVIITQFTVGVFLIILLFLVDPKLVLSVCFSLSAIYLIIFYFAHNYLNRVGEEKLKNNQLRFTALSEAFAAAKEIKVGGLEDAYIKSFSNSSKIFAKTQAYARVISLVPRYIMEAIAFGGIMLIILYNLKQTGSFNSVLPIVSLYVFAGYRLMPAFQQIYASFTQLAFIGSSIDKLIEDLKDLEPFDKNFDKEILVFDKSIVIKNVSYNYPNSDRNALESINLTIPVKSVIGFVGTTGSGKTTLVDIILGLLEPREGILKVDEKVIKNKNKRSWQKLIGYVPQNIYLSDNTVAGNIAFGEESKCINYDFVEKVAKIAQLHNFVNEELSKKYHTTVGERGVRLSGGQRQRIGIARALYHNPKVLILDEATSALDNQTEKEVINAICNFNNDLTIILIAHRLNTVKNCDIIYKLDKGQIKKSGTFNELFNNKIIY